LRVNVTPPRDNRINATTPHYAGNPVAPLRRKRNGSYMPEIHKATAGLNTVQVTVDEWKGLPHPEVSAEAANQHRRTIVRSRSFNRIDIRGSS
jgi:hypothetical protein